MKINRPAKSAGKNHFDVLDTGEFDIQSKFQDYNSNNNSNSNNNNNNK